MYLSINGIKLKRVHTTRADEKGKEVRDDSFAPDPGFSQGLPAWYVNQKQKKNKTNNGFTEF